MQDAWRSLGDADPWLRHAARNVIEQHPAGQWSERALREPDLAAALTALTALARSGGHQQHVVARLNQLEWHGAGHELETAALYCYWLATKAQPMEQRLHQATAAKLAKAFPTEHYEGNRLLSELIVRLEIRDEYEQILQQLERSAEQHEQLHYLFVLRNKKSLTTDQRRRYFEAMVESLDYAGGRGLPDFVRRIREEAIAATPDAASLADVIERSQATEPPPAKHRPFVRKWTLEALTPNLTFKAASESAARGKGLFAAASCTQCHRAENVGRSIGPDLTTVARRFSRQDMLTSILHPSRVIAEKYRSLQVVLKDGRSLTGRVATSGDYRSPVLRIAVDATRPFQFTEVKKDDIELQRPSPTSWMPAGLLDTLSESEIHDLLAYLESLAR